MNRTFVDRIVKAVLYEGYILYPYRPSVKNHQRWTFGGLYPEACCQIPGGSDAASNQTECLVEGNPQTTLDVTIRFLHLIERTVGEFIPSLADWPAGTEPTFRSVEALRIGDQVFHAWQEAEERVIDVTGVALGDIVNAPIRRTFTVPSRRWLEPLRGPGGAITGVLVRRQEAIEGAIEAQAFGLGDGLFKVTVRVMNHTLLDASPCPSRDDALLHTLVSTHAILGVHDGAFVSLLDPPPRWYKAATGCRNVGTWPVLVGEEGDRDTLLSSPIILYDYPQVSAESPGDLFDATEIDEILTLRILTLTDEEKRAAAAIDERARDLLARTETLAREQLAGLHGTFRPV
jgi:hydrogenase maturation protease